MIGRDKVLMLVFIIVLGAGIAWVGSHVTVKTIKHRELPDESILSNPMAALQHLLIELNIQAESFRDRQLLHELPDTGDAILMRNMKQPLTEEREKALLEWVKQGGKLLMEPYWLGQNDDRQYLHEKLGIIEKEIENWEETEFPVHADALIDNEVIFLHFSNRYELILAQDDSISLMSEASRPVPLAQSELGIHAAKVTFGQGEFIIFSDSMFLNTPPVWLPDEERGNFFNDEISLLDHDHPYFIWSLLKDRKKVWILHETISPSFISIVYQRFPLLTLFFAIWLILYFLYLLKRFGPVISSELGVQRDLNQHLIQAGRFHWHQDKANRLLIQWRERIKQRLFRRHPQLAGLEEAVLFERLQSLTKLNSNDIYRAWHSTCRNETEFVNIIQSLKILWTI